MGPTHAVCSFSFITDSHPDCDVLCAPVVLIVLCVVLRVCSDTTFEFLLLVLWCSLSKLCGEEATYFYLFLRIIMKIGELVDFDFKVVLFVVWLCSHRRL